MESAIVIAPHDYDKALRQRLAARWPVHDVRPGAWAIEDGDSRVYVSRDDFVGEELEPERLRRITAQIRTPVYYTVSFSDLDLVRKVLLSVADDAKLLVDNDHGVLLPGPEFVRALLRTDWDWRLDRP